MITARLSGPADFASWRTEARRLGEAGVAPQEVEWRCGAAEEDLFGPTPSDVLPEGLQRNLSVPRRFLDLAEMVICHRDPGRFALLYRMLLRLQREPALVTDGVDADVARAEGMARAVRRDLHKMTAFVRFRGVADAGEDGPSSPGSSRSTSFSREPRRSSPRASPRCAGRS